MLVSVALSPCVAEGKPPTRDVPLGTYRLHVSLAYQAQASSDTPTNNPPPSESPTSPYWNFSTESESANVTASWSDELKLTAAAQGSHDYSLLPVNFIHGDGELHDVEFHPLGSPGIDASISDTYSGTYDSPVEQTCQETCPPTAYKPIQFTCSSNLANTQLEPDLVIHWEQKTNLARFQKHGYLNPTNPGAVAIGASFLLGSRLTDQQAKVRQQGESTGAVSPTCPAGVNIFEPWSSDEAMLSPEYFESASPSNRAVYFPLDTLIHKGRASSTFTGQATSPTKCCAGTTKMTLTITAARLR
jgi:hypothetical protein